MALIDLHSHLLPGIDDGSPDLLTSLRLAQQAVADGVQQVLVTPHHLNGRYLNHKAEVLKRTAQFRLTLSENEIPLKVFPGQEVRLNGGLLDAIAADDILYADKAGHYLMLELPSDSVPQYTRQLIYQLLQQGIIPVIVHPERNAGILADPNKLAELLRLGCLTQITASSYVGAFGKRVAWFTWQLIKAGQVACVASDAHVLIKREYQLSDAYRRLTTQFGQALTNRYRENAWAIFNGQPVVLNWQPIKPKHFWLF